MEPGQSLGTKNKFTLSMKTLDRARVQSGVTMCAMSTEKTAFRAEDATTSLLRIILHFSQRLVLNS
jgi:hypothetical protein